jgi:hypothetical protein
MNEGLEHLDENPEEHIGDELPDPWDDESQSDWRSRWSRREINTVGKIEDALGILVSDPKAV